MVFFKNREVLVAFIFPIGFKSLDTNGMGEMTALRWKDILAEVCNVLRRNL